MVGSGTGSSCWPLNFGSLHHVKRSSLNTLYIAHLSGSSNWNTLKLMSFKILNGLYLFWSSFFEGWFNWIFLFSNHTLSLTFNPWGFLLFLSNCLFVRHGLHWGESPQDRLGDEWTCGMTLASAYVLCHMSAMWSQLQMKRRKSE